ncbi:MAG: HU domain-containing protein [Flavitalea sp.]
MFEVLNSYLVQNKSISIPGLGTIYVERIPARYDFVNRSILPPAYQFRFDKYFDAPDKEFFTYLASEKQIADFEAIKIYNEWAYEFRNRIRGEEIVTWDGVGVLQQDPSGEILFEPINDLNADINPVRAERVVRTDAAHSMLVGDKETTTTEMTEFLQEDVSSRKKTGWIIAAVVAAIALSVFFIRFYSKGFNVESTANEQRIDIR